MSALRGSRAIPRIQVSFGLSLAHSAQNFRQGARDSIGIQYAAPFSSIHFTATGRRPKQSAHGPAGAEFGLAAAENAGYAFQLFRAARTGPAPQKAALSLPFTV